jgi:hypothetical protein
LLSALAILLQLVPGLVTAAPDLTNVPTIGQTIGGDNPLAGVRIFQPDQPIGLLGILSPPATARLYLIVPMAVPPENGPTQVIVDDDLLTIGQGPERTFHYVTTQPGDGNSPVTSASLVTQRQDDRVYVLPVADGTATSWALAGAIFRLPADGLLPLPHVGTLLQSGRWSPTWVALVALGLAFIGFSLGNRRATPVLAGTTAALLVLVLLSGLAAAFFSEILGRRAAQPNYALALVIVVPALIIAATLGLAVVVGRLVQKGLEVALPDRQETYNSWLITKTSAAVALPLLVAIILLSVDFAVFAVAPGLTL